MRFLFWIEWIVWCFPGFPLVDLILRTLVESINVKYRSGRKEERMGVKVAMSQCCIAKAATERYPWVGEVPTHRVAGRLFRPPTTTDGRRAMDRCSSL